MNTVLEVPPEQSLRTFARGVLMSEGDVVVHINDDIRNRVRLLAKTDAVVAKLRKAYGDTLICNAAVRVVNGETQDDFAVIETPGGNRLVVTSCLCESSQQLIRLALSSAYPVLAELPKSKTKNVVAPKGSRKCRRR